MKKPDIKNIKVIQAPMAGISDSVFRGMIRKYGSECLLTTEMLSSEMLCNSKKIEKQRILKFEDIEYPLSFQLMGHKTDKMTNAAKIIAPYASMIDINCGCPVKKVAASNDGAMLMKTPSVVSDIIKSVKDATGLMVSVKFRLGWTKDEENFLEFAKAMENAGADFVTLHARYRSQMYQGKSDWNKIRLLKKELKIPVFANGDITTAEEAKSCLELTKCDGVSIGRGIMGDFTLPYRIEKYIRDGEAIEVPSLEVKIEMLKEHLKKEAELMGETNGVKFMRKFFCCYVSSVKNASKYRSILVSLDTVKEINDTLDEILRIHSLDS